MQTNLLKIAIKPNPKNLPLTNPTPNPTQLTHLYNKIPVTNPAQSLLNNKTTRHSNKETTNLSIT
jgi:hypothetical protein